MEGAKDDAEAVKKMESSKAGFRRPVVRIFAHPQGSLQAEMVDVFRLWTGSMVEQVSSSPFIIIDTDLI